MDKDLKTMGIVVSRTNYGEADRILNIITPVGRVAVIAKGVRKAKSKLAGGIELFTLSDLNIHQGKGEMGILTSAKMKEHYGEILKTYERMELAGMILKKVNAVEDLGEGSYFEIVKQCLEGLNNGVSVELVEGWFWLNLTKAMGEEMNLHRDMDGNKLVEDLRYDWDVRESGFRVNERGEFGANEIKLLRMIVTAKLSLVRRVKIDDEMMKKILSLAKIVGKL